MYEYADAEKQKYPDVKNTYRNEIMWKYTEKDLGSPPSIPPTPTPTPHITVWAEENDEEKDAG